jgi:hypothetical protein
MKITIEDAFTILGIPSGYITPEGIKNAYRKAAQIYHPDRNSAGLEMMKLINAAFESIKNFNGEVVNHNNKNYAEQINQALNSILGLGLTIEICGAWVWLSGITKPHKEALKNAGFQWAPKKFLWYFRPNDVKSRKHKAWSMDAIRSRYGSEFIDDKQHALHSS